MTAQNTDQTTWETFSAGLTDEQRALLDSQIKAATHKANEEAKGLRGRAKGSEELIAKLKARFEVDELSDDVLDQLQRMPAEKLGAEERAKHLERKAKELETERNKYRDELSATQQKVAEKQRDDGIVQVLGKIGVRPDALDAARKLLAIDAVLGEEGWTYNGKPLDEYAQEWAKGHAYLLANPVAPGAGTRAQTGNSTAGALTLAAWESATPEWRRSHLDEFRKAMAAGTLK